MIIKIKPDNQKPWLRPGEVSAEIIGKCHIDPEDGAIVLNSHTLCKGFEDICCADTIKRITAHPDGKNPVIAVEVYDPFLNPDYLENIYYFSVELTDAEWKYLYPLMFQ